MRKAAVEADKGSLSSPVMEDEIWVLETVSARSSVVTIYLLLRQQTGFVLNEGAQKILNWIPKLRVWFRWNHFRNQ